MEIFSDTSYESLPPTGAAAAQCHPARGAGLPLAWTRGWSPASSHPRDGPASLSSQFVQLENSSSCDGRRIHAASSDPSSRYLSNTCLVFTARPPVFVSLGILYLPEVPKVPLLPSVPGLWPFLSMWKLFEWWIWCQLYLYIVAQLYLCLDLVPKSLCDYWGHTECWRYV